MKKILICSVLGALALSWSGGMVWAQGKGRAEQGTRAGAKSDAPDRGKASQEDVAVGKDRGKAAQNGMAKFSPSGSERKGKPAEADVAEKKGKTAEEGIAKAKPVQKGAGKGHQQQLMALRKQIAKEQAKHLRRRARLERIKQLAADAGKTDVVARVDTLVSKEDDRYRRRYTAMQEQELKIQQLGEKGLSEEAPQPVGKAKAGQKPENAKQKTEKEKPEAEKPSDE